MITVSLPFEEFEAMRAELASLRKSSLERLVREHALNEELCTARTMVGLLTNEIDRLTEAFPTEVAAIQERIAEEFASGKNTADPETFAVDPLVLPPEWTPRAEWEAARKARLT